MSDTRDLKVRQSYHTAERNKSSHSNFFSKSDLNVSHSGSSDTPSSRNCKNYLDDLIKISDRSRGEYYKRYEHDEVPVKDHDDDKYKTQVETSLTDLELAKLETRIFRNVSQELQTDECSLSSLESNIKFFKTTVEKIFDNFYNNMRDFELYKRRFQEILARSKEGSMDDMEEFIKDMFEHIMTSSDNSTSNISEGSDIKQQDTINTCSSTDTDTDLTDSAAVQEAYKNENYLTDTSLDDKSSKNNKSLKIDDIFNVFLLDGNPCVQIKLNERNLLSEVNIQEPKAEPTTVSSIVSADNMRKVTTKKIELEEYGKQDVEMPEREIPVKVSYAKKNIYLDEDFTLNTENTETAKSFLSRICNLLCKKFRKTTLG